MAENRYSTLFEELKEAVISNKPEGAITDINRAGVSLLGFSAKEDVLGKNIADFYCDLYYLQHFTGLMKEQGYVKDMEVEWKTRDGQEKVVLITSTAVRDVSGRIVEHRGIVKDVTERVRDQQKLIKMAVELSEVNEKLKSTQVSLFQQEKLASIGQLSAGLAHEINNPLGFVKSNFNSLKKYLKVLLEYTDLLEQGLSSLRVEDSEATIQAVLQMNKNRDRLRIDFINKDLKELLAESEEGFSRIMSTIQGMKRFSRIDFADSIAEYDLNDAIETTLIVARNEFKYVARVEKSLGCLPAVECRADEINQVLLNIIINAAQALKEQHREEQGLISISTHSTGNQVICRISDNGPGIPEEIRHRIFDPFFTTKPVGQGTGLGLSISYEIIVNGHGGELSVDSTTDGGTFFTIKLPVHYMRNQVAAEALGE
ncbi:Signal transduction histidine-protein kinase AtoS [subsurface metagenome]